MVNSISFLQKLIQIKSYSGKEKELAEFIIDYCKNHHIPAQTQSGNVVIHLKGEDSSKALIFNAHLDTVGEGERKKWKYPPFGKKAGKIVGGKIYGLGASDDKAAIAVMLALVNQYTPGELLWATSGVKGRVEKSVKPPFDLWFSFVTKEETDGSGTARFLDWFTKLIYFKEYKKTAAIISEPTDLAVLEIGHRGNAFIRLQTFGISGHGAKEYQADELAVEKMLKAVKKLKWAFKGWREKYRHKVLGKPSMNITSFQTKEKALNKIPSSCKVVLDIRTTPAFHNNLISKVKNTVGESVKVDLVKRNRPPGLTSGNSRIVKALKKTVPNSPITVSFGSTDICQFNEKGIETVVFGPGKRGVMHKENEYVEISKVKKCVKIYTKLIECY